VAVDRGDVDVKPSVYAGRGRRRVDGAPCTRAPLFQSFAARFMCHLTSHHHLLAASNAVWKLLKNILQGHDRGLQKYMTLTPRTGVISLSRLADALLRDNHLELQIQYYM